MPSWGTTFGWTEVDPDGAPELLSYVWSFVALPEASALDGNGLLDASTPVPTFFPDVAGAYVLRLEVADGVMSGYDNIVVNVVSPVAVE